VRMTVETLACTSVPRLGREAQPKATRKASGGVGNGGRPSHFNVGLRRVLGMVLEDTRAFSHSFLFSLLSLS
jgi:hypothetical protein